MDMLKAALTVSPQMKAALEAEQRRLDRQAARAAEKTKGGDERIAKAEAKRARKRNRNLALAEGNGG